MIIQIPDKLEPEKIAAFSNQLNGLEEMDEYVFDFGKTRWFSPFSMLLLSRVLNQFKAERQNSRRRALNFENHSYAAHLGFFRSFGLRHGNEPGEAIGNDRYVPLQTLTRAELDAESVDMVAELGDLIEAKSSRLAAILTQGHDEVLHETLTYSIREIFRNVFEHSNCEEVSFCAQYWPTKKLVEVGIVDAGIGVRTGLAKNPKFRNFTNLEALQASLMPGISGNVRAGKGKSAWQNSGYGLYMTNRICRNGGCFRIISGEDGILLENGEKTNFSAALQGTAIQLLIDVEAIDDLRDSLQRFAREGRLVAQKINGANTNVASTASQMLTKDFREDE